MIYLRYLSRVEKEEEEEVLKKLLFILARILAVQKPIQKALT